jgi:hypothetical protein
LCLSLFTLSTTVKYNDQNKCGITIVYSIDPTLEK